MSEVRAVYYILEGTVYQCPGIDELATSRLAKCSFHLANAFDAIREVYEPKFEDEESPSIEEALGMTPPEPPEPTLKRQALKLV